MDKRFSTLRRKGCLCLPAQAEWCDLGLSNHRVKLTIVVFNQVAAGCQPAVQSSAPDNGRKHRPKHAEQTLNNKLIYIGHLVGYFRSCITIAIMFQNYKKI